MCTVSLSGAIDQCEILQTIGLTAPGSIDMQGQRAWLTDLATSAIETCQLNAGVLSGCKAFTSSALVSPLGVAVAGNTLYASNQDNKMSVCALGSNGEPQSCKTDTANGTLDNPLNLVARGSRLFVANQDSNTVTVCTIGTDGSLLNCTAQSGNGEFDQPSGITATDTAIYVTNIGDDSLTSCPLSAMGTFGTCSKYRDPLNLDRPMDVSVHGAVAYVTNMGNHTISQCTLSPGGRVSRCESGTADGVFDLPAGIVFSSAGS
ncbi:hypothetical protein YK56LOC_38890 [Caballeronia sp. HLA56]